ncbi:glycoside hydrolase family 88 protein [Blastococcus atacamensis]|uniref:glycoside hydrolase family 88 protein n=1 Tax=Blastococcus atacamensis TaxID=2070508 RepID=UPI0018E40096|nr:glycoside hydrolase family 88 protein [Blastococcus atacamensis]
MLTCLLVAQRHSWDQGLTAAVLEDSGEEDALRVLVDDAVARQLCDGRLAELDPACSVNGAALAEFVGRVAQRAGDESLARAAARQRSWLLREAPRTADGTLCHLVGSRQVWADTVYMVVPALASAGATREALAQLEGHRARLHDRETGLWAARWDEDAGRLVDARAWGTGNGWVAAGSARAVRWLPGASGAEVAAHVRSLLEACLERRRSDGLFGAVLDDPAGPADTNVASMLAYAALTGAAEGWLPWRSGRTGESLLAAAAARVDDLGRVAGASAAPHFDRPGHAPEAQAFLLLADGAHERWREAGRRGVAST